VNRAAQLDALRRIADVKNMLARQELLRSDHQAQGLPVERIDDFVEILRGCLAVIEASLKTDDLEPLLLAPPTTLAREAA
jgi:hypothetical protein